MIEKNGIKKEKVAIVWFKRDLRVVDNRALQEASEKGSILPIFIVEPEYWSLPDMSGRQWDFVRECLFDLRCALGKLGQPLIVRIGDVLSIFRILKQNFEIDLLYSHEETGNFWTYERDKKVAEWCRSEGVSWIELQQHGVQRRLKSRDGWAKAWDIKMSEPLTKPLSLRPITNMPLGIIPTAQEIALKADVCSGRQIGGRAISKAVLRSFLTKRGENYRTEMSDPLKAVKACSRISPHLAWGALSMREVAQAAHARKSQLKADGSAKQWHDSMSSFTGRLYWHCHFIQKLEDSPILEFKNMHRAYDTIRTGKPDRYRLAAWVAGETGLPFVDACMRSLNATGWLNFRMRAMLMAVASYHLWLDWRKPGEHLARMFTDYEPGIHWPQVQMQSGTTGVNKVRIYNPVKQGMEQDPTGVFTRRWVPELRKIECNYLQQPWKSDKARGLLGEIYPLPIVDHFNAAKKARKKIWAVRKDAGFEEAAKAIRQKHSSRRSGIKLRGGGLKTKNDRRQLSFCFDLD